MYFVGGNFFGWFGEYAFDSSELPILTLYPFYIPILVRFMIVEKDIHPIKRFALPILSCIGVVIMVIASIASHGEKIWYYLVLFAAVMLSGVLCYRKDGKTIARILGDKIKNIVK